MTSYPLFVCGQMEMCIRDRTKVFDKSHGYRIMKNTEMKERHIIRYADDFRICCRTKEDAVRTKEAVTAWIEERLKLEAVSYTHLGALRSAESPLQGADDFRTG